MDRIYLDYAATTPTDERVVKEMLPYFDMTFGNPSSVHTFGQKADGAIEAARKKILGLLNADEYELIFTSGGTESDNLAVRGAAFHERSKRGANKILISPVEHHAVSKTVEKLVKENGFEKDLLRVDKYGSLDLNYLEDTITNETAIVSVIYANNEIGTINPISDTAMICKKKGILFHTDAVQAVPHLPIDLKSTPVDLFSFCAHKLYGPKGIGGLIINKNVQLISQITGGKQENGFRGGTQNVPAIVGMAKALEINSAEQAIEQSRLKALRDELTKSVLTCIPGALLTGDPVNRLSNHASFVFDGVNGNELVIALDIAGYAVSSGSACKVGTPEPSEVLSAIGIASELALSSIRVTLGKFTNQKEIQGFVSTLKNCIDTFRKTG